MQILSTNIPFLWIISFIALILLSYVIIFLIIKPWTIVKFYEHKGFITEFKPIVGTFSYDDTSVTLRDQYYARMIDMCSLPQRPLGLVRNVGRTCMIMLYDAQMIREIFINKDAFVKHPFQNTIMKYLSPFGLVLLEGDLWKKHRKMVSRGFDYERIESVIPTIMRCSKERLSSLGKVNNIGNLINFFKETAGQIIGEVYFNYDLNQKKINGVPLTIYLSDTIAYLSRLSYSPLYCATNFEFVKLGLFQDHRKALQKVKLLRQAVKEIVQQCISKLKSNSAKNNFNMWKIFSEGQQNQTFNQEEMIDEFITFFSDGVYTTGLFMTMFTYYMIQNPTWKNRLRDELKQNILENKEPITQQLIQNLPVLQGCIKQTLRLAPPVVTGIERIAIKDTGFSNGVIIKKDTMVMACHLVNHIDPKYHDEPLVFDPLRWKQGTKTTQMMKEYPGSYIPFSIGERNCPGQKFAQIQSSILFANLFSQFDISLSDPDYKLQFTQRFLRQPLNPMACAFNRIS